jgi:hypothetical protein
MAEHQKIKGLLLFIAVALIIHLWSVEAKAGKKIGVLILFLIIRRRKQESFGDHRMTGGRIPVVRVWNAGPCSEKS